MDRRVVITGMGAITPVGNNVNEFWLGIKEGKNGIDLITHFDTADQKAIMGGEVKDFEYSDKKAGKRLDRSSQFGLTAASEAVLDSGLVSGENIDPHRFGVIAGTGIGGIMTLEKETRKAYDRGVSRVSALLVPMVIPNILAGNLAINFSAKASCIGIVTACSAGTHSIGEAYRTIKHGYADAMISGGSEAAFAPVCFSGFANMTALSTRKDKNRCSTPFDKERDGFVMGEGSGFVILEELEHALARNAKIYGEIVGYGTTCDAYHITSPSPTGEGAAAAMQQAIDEAGIKPNEVDYINAHGTGTPYNDLFETIAIKSVFGEDAYNIPVSSTKSMTGHLLGAAGAIEAVICVKAIENGIVPPTINLEVPDEELDLDYVPGVGREKELNYVMSNSLGFGGHNGTILIKKYV
ncbi:beta-ketoacyl-ACP synthase II [Anaerovorax odorimutans]|uniref:beta-ketoacyl-ACP synthase II n=1 Tax=Anaerovorax odorimutans TaxID=109327 RepID=UPI00040D09AB|nr:beta-ketoacyl-ACP synthase II [Anaerovorax odorimutans]